MPENLLPVRRNARNRRRRREEEVEVSPRKHPTWKVTSKAGSQVGGLDLNWLFDQLHLITRLSVSISAFVRPSDKYVVDVVGGCCGPSGCGGVVGFLRGTQKPCVVVLYVTLFHKIL